MAEPGRADHRCDFPRGCGRISDGEGVRTGLLFPMDAETRWSRTSVVEHDVRITAGRVVLEGTLAVPEDAAGVVLFAHGSGSSRFSTRNRRVAQRLQAAGFGTLLFDLLTSTEEREDEVTAALRFDIGMLAGRLRHATRWVRDHASTRELPVGYFGASTGAAAALVAAALEPGSVSAVVSRGGRPDLAGEHLAQVRAPTLLIVGGEDEPVIPLNEEALRQLRGTKRLEIVRGATHLFGEAGALDAVAELAVKWFSEYSARRGGGGTEGEGEP